MGVVDSQRGVRRASALGLLSIALIGLATCGKRGASPSPQQQGGPVPVRVAAAVRRDVPLELTAIGTVEAFAIVNVKAQVGGTLISVGFSEGQTVTRGQILFRIDPRPYQAALAEARAKLAADQARLQQALAEEQRQRKLLERQVSPRAIYDQARATAGAQVATVDADRATIETAELNLSYCVIRSPIAGKAGKRLVDVGNLIKANADTAMVVLRQIQPIYVSFSLPEQNLDQVRARQAQAALPVTVTVKTTPSQGARAATGKLGFIDNAVDRSTGTILLKAELANQDELLWPGQFVDVSLRVSELRGVVVVPGVAVQTGQQGKFVYVVKGGRAELRPVQTGPAVGEDSVIERGVAAGETVVTDGQIRLRPGARVAPRGQAAAHAEASAEP